MTAVTRNMVADYLKVGDEFVLAGTGFNTLDENPGAQIDSKIYICDKSASKNIKSYETTFPFEADMYTESAVLEDLYNIGRNQAIGQDARREFVRTDILVDALGAPIQSTVSARKFTVAVEVTSLLSGAGGEVAKVSGTLHAVASPVMGDFNLVTRVFTPKEAVIVSE